MFRTVGNSVLNTLVKRGMERHHSRFLSDFSTQLTVPYGFGMVQGMWLCDVAVDKSAIIFSSVQLD